MKWYLNSGSASQLYEQHFFQKKVISNNISNLLVIANQHHLGIKHSFDRFIAGEPELFKTIKVNLFDPGSYKQGQLLAYDAIYVTGGEYQLWDSNVVEPAGDRFVDEFKQFLFRKQGCYFGSSLGLEILFSKFHSEMEINEEHKSIWYENGLQIFQDILPEVHYSLPNNLEFLKSRHLKTLEKYPQFEYGVMFSGDCVIEIDSRDIMDWKILSGSYEVNKYYSEL